MGMRAVLAAPRCLRLGIHGVSLCGQAVGGTSSSAGGGREIAARRLRQIASMHRSP